MGDTARIEIKAEETGKDAPKPDDTNQRPEWCPEKFWVEGKVDEQGMAKSYSELEKAQSKPADQKKAEATPDDDKAKQQVPESSIPGVTKESTEKFTKELQEKGHLSDASFAELEKAGYKKPIVEAYVKGLQNDTVVQQTRVKDVHAIAGGEESYSVMIQWAGANLAPAEVVAYDTAMNSQNAETMALAAKGLHAKYVEQVGSEPNLLRGGKTSVEGPSFKSQAEVTAAMNDPRYKIDEAFRDEVRNKIDRSSIM